MKIYPPNLGNRYYVRLIRQRSSKAPKTLELNDPLPEPKLGFLGRLWSRGTPLTQEQAAQAAPAAAAGTRAAGFATVFLGSYLAALPTVAIAEATHNGGLAFATFAASVAGLALLGFGPIARGVFLHAHRALTLSEVDAMIAQTQDELSRSYLQLVRDAILVETSPEAQSKVREALAHLGEALDGLPRVVLEPHDTVLLRTEAVALQEQAAVETDPVIAESLRRRAESVQQRAESQEKSALVARRTEALREEIRAKIAALRDALAAQQTGALDDTALDALSESARSVAQESHNTAAAQSELERYLIPQEAPLIQQSRQ